MSWLNHEWLGYAATPGIAGQIVAYTGYFYLSIAAAYLLSFLYGLWHSSSVQKMRHHHSICITLWALLGLSLFIFPKIALYVNALLVILGLQVLLQFRYTHALIAEGAIEPPLKDDKKAQYFLTRLKKSKLTLNDAINCSLMNERILWLLILYRALITLRASLF